MKVSALVLIALTFPFALTAQSVPERTLRNADTLPDPYSRIRGVRELSDGRVLVADQREVAVYLADFRSGRRVKIGREGAGPREYRSPVGLARLRGDSTLLIDFANGRIAVLNPSGEITGTFSYRRFGRIMSNVGSGTRGHIYFESRGSDGDGHTIYRWRRPDEVLDTLAALAPAERFALDGREWPVPWSVREVWAVGADGRVAVVRRDPYRVEWIETNGTVRSAPPVDDEPIPVTRADRAAWNERPGVTMVRTSPNAPRGPARWEFPEHFPPFVFRGASISPDGLLWVERKQSDAEPRPLLDVFDQEGRLVERVRLPAGRDVVGFGEGTIYATREDEVGLLWLERYRY